MSRTSRTGTGKWKNLRRRTLHQALATGQTRCPLCGVPFDWTRSRTPASPEVDHIIPHALGGTDTPDNVRVICRACNGRLGGYLAARQRHAKRQAAPAPTVGTLTTSQSW